VETKEALHNLTLTESYITAFLDQNLKHKASPLLGVESHHSKAIVKQYGQWFLWWWSATLRRTGVNCSPTVWNL